MVQPHPEHQPQPPGEGAAPARDSHHPLGARPGSGATSVDPTRRGVPGAPFIWQDGSRLLLLVRERESWILAELRFVSPECRYVEHRRARFVWAREAAGAMLARGIATDPASRGRLARGIAHWIAEVSPESIVAS